MEDVAYKALPEFYLFHDSKNIHWRIFYMVPVLNKILSVYGYSKTDIFIRYMLSVYEDVKKRILSYVKWSVSHL